MMEPFVYKQKLDMCSVDFMGRWQPGAIFRAMQEAGNGHCELLNLTFEQMREQDLAWVLSRARIRMDEYPNFGQEVTVKTWPSPTRHGFFPRNFTFEVDGRVLGCAVSVFVLFDLATRKIASPSSLMHEIPVYDIPATLPFPSNIKNITTQERSVAYTPVYTDLDMNGHVNNTRYVDWYMNQFSIEKHKCETLCDLLVHYNLELMPSEALSFVLREENDLCVMQGIHNEQICFAMQGVWKLC